MKQVYHFNPLTGEFIEAIHIGENEELPKDCTFEKWTPPIWKPVFKNGSWIEGATEEEMKPAVTPPTVEAQLEEEKAKVRRLETQLNQTNADLQGFMDFYFDNTGL
jgi:hypothetical protein